MVQPAYSAIKPSQAGKGSFVSPIITSGNSHVAGCKGIPTGKGPESSSYFSGCLWGSTCAVTASGRDSPWQGCLVGVDVVRECGVSTTLSAASSAVVYRRNPSRLLTCGCRHVHHGGRSAAAWTNPCGFPPCDGGPRWAPHRMNRWGAHRRPAGGTARRNSALWWTRTRRQTCSHCLDVRVMGTRCASSLEGMPAGRLIRGIAGEARRAPPAGHRASQTANRGENT